MNAIAQYLGGNDLLNHPVDTKMDLLEIANEGVSKQSLVYFCDKIDLSLKAIANLLDTSERTIQRRDNLSRDKSEHLLQLAEVYSKGEEVFTSLERFNIWLKSSCVALNRKKPISLLNSRYGIQMVMSELGKIEHGVFA